MSQFAHGIRSFDPANLNVPSGQSNILFLLGVEYDKSSKDVAQKYWLHFRHLIWMTYRRDFDNLTNILKPYNNAKGSGLISTNTNFTSDAGWGCMLRSAQMIAAEAFQHHFNLTPTATARDNQKRNQVLSWFLDSTNLECIYSLHHMVKIGMQYDKIPGEWYGPTTASLVLRDLVNLHSKELGGEMSMYVPQEGVIYTEEVTDICSLKEELRKNETKQEDAEAGFFYDPLLNPPKAQPQKKWTTSLLILIPLRLGLDSLNQSYVPVLSKTFEIPQSVGIIGGKRGHSVYFIGSQGPQFHLLDPHTVHPCAELNSSFPTATHLSTVSCSTPLVMDVSNIDPSLALGFYCRDEADYEDFCERVSLLNQKMLCPFSISEKRPDYTNDFEMSASENESSDEGEQEYVFV